MPNPRLRGRVHALTVFPVAVVVIALRGAAAADALAATPRHAAMAVTAVRSGGGSAIDGWKAVVLLLVTIGQAAVILFVLSFVLSDRAARVAAICAAFAVVVVALQDPLWWTALRAPLVVAFVFFAPGWALLNVWDLARGWAGVGLAVAISISLATVIPGALLYAGDWSPSTALLILVGITVLAGNATIARTVLRSAHPRA